MPPVASTDLLLDWAISRPEDDVSTTGGAIDNTGASSAPGMSPSFTQIAAPDTIQIVSDGADTRTITVTVRKADGSIASEAGVLNGTTPVDLTTLGTDVNRVLKAIATTTSATRIATIQRKNGGSPIAISTIPVNRKGLALMFYDSSSDAASTMTRYELIYWRNAHATLALNAAKVQISVDATPSGKLRQGIGLAKGDLGTIANRLSVPASIVFVGPTVDQNVPSGVLGATERIGVWIELALGIGDSPISSSFSSRLAGSTV
jgi:hypothetical protein